MRSKSAELEKKLTGRIKIIGFKARKSLTADSFDIANVNTDLNSVIGTALGTAGDVDDSGNPTSVPFQAGSLATKEGVTGLLFTAPNNRVEIGIRLQKRKSLTLQMATMKYLVV